MNVHERKLVILDLALALIVLALFGLAPATFNSHDADADLIQMGSDVGSGNEVRTSTIARSPTF